MGVWPKGGVALMTAVPGAHVRTHGPKLLNDAFLPVVGLRAATLMKR